MPSAYSFESDLTFKEAVKMFDATENWIHKPNLAGKWLIRDNDRWGDYLSYFAYDEADRTIVKTICIFFDTCPQQVTLGVSRDQKAATGVADIERAWHTHESYVLQVLLPSIGARNLKPSDFER